MQPDISTLIGQISKSIEEARVQAQDAEAQQTADAQTQLHLLTKVRRLRSNTPEQVQAAKASESYQSLRLEDVKAAVVERGLVLDQVAKDVQSLGSLLQQSVLAPLDQTQSGA